MKTLVACILSTVLATTSVCSPVPSAAVAAQDPAPVPTTWDQIPADDWDPELTDMGCLPDIVLNRTVYSTQGAVIRAELPEYYWTEQPTWDGPAVVIEIVRQEDNSIVFHRKIRETSFTIEIDLHPGEYLLRTCREMEWYTLNSFAYFSVVGPSQLLHLAGEVVADGNLETPEFCDLLGIRLEWDDSPNGGPYTLTRTLEWDGERETTIIDSIGQNHYMDIDKLSGGIFTYTVSDGDSVWNQIVVDLSGFPPLEYAGNRNEKVIVLRLYDPYMYTAKDRDSVYKLSDLTRIGPIDKNNLGVVPTLINDRTMIPVAALVKEMGGSAVWDGKRRLVTIKIWDSTRGKDSVLEIPIDSTTMYVNNKEISFDTPAQIRNDRTLVPIRQLEQLGCEVDWLAASRGVRICYQERENS